jgi:hypothetical protein
MGDTSAPQSFLKGNSNMSGHGLMLTLKYCKDLLLLIYYNTHLW